MKKILLINGHPSKDTFTSKLFESYKKGAVETGHETKEIHVTDMPIEKFLRFNHYRDDNNSEEVKNAQQDISWAEHIVVFHPVWWGGMPAILKCFFDVVFSSGFAFRFKSGSPMPEKLLAGKSGHIISTMDTPVFIYKYFFRAPSVNQLKSRILDFCGVSPVKVTLFGPIQSSKKEVTDKFIEQTYQLGKNIK